MKQNMLRISALMIWFTSFLEATERKPNIVFFFIDDMGFADPSCFGNPHAKTPHIDQLAKDGIKLTNFYVNSPICSASRAAVTTGHYPGRLKIHSYLNSRANNAARGMNDYLSPEAPTTARAFKNAGYATAHFGKWHMGGGRDVDDAPRPQAYGFDESLVNFEGMGDKLSFKKGAISETLTDVHGTYTVTALPKHDLTKAYVDRGIDFIRRNKNKPFYLRVFPNDVHDAHVPLPGTDEKWTAVTDNHYNQKFFAVLEEMDRQIGRVINTIDDLGLAENTLIIFTSDNGPTDWPKYYGQGFDPPGFTGPYFGRKWSLFEGGIRMPFIARWKGKIPAGVTDHQSVVSAIDLSPTLRNFAEVTKHPSPDGYDRGDVLLGKPSKRPGPLFWQYGPPHAKLKPGKREFVSPPFAMRTGDWKMLVAPDGTAARLFNLINDEGEQTNLIDEEPERAAVMWQQIQQWAKDLEFEVGGALQKAAPLPQRQIIPWAFDKESLSLEGHDLIVQNSSWWFDGKEAHLSLSKKQAPNVAKSGFRILATIEPKPDTSNGVILAHGGNRMGYALYLKDRHVAFVVTADWKRTVLKASTPVNFDERTRIDATLSKDGKMSLRINGKEIASSTSELLLANPGDSLEIGSDLIQPVGDYPVPNAYSGAIHHLRLEILR